IYVDLRDRDLGGYVADAQKAIAAQIKFPPGTYVTWSGQFEYLQRAKARLKIVVPVTALIIFLLLYLNFRRVTETLIVMLSVPFALVGGSAHRAGASPLPGPRSPAPCVATRHRKAW